MEAQFKLRRKFSLSCLKMASEPPSKKPCSKPTKGMIQYPGEDPAVTRFREFLSIRTVSVKDLDTPGPQPDYGKYSVI